MVSFLTRVIGRQKVTQPSWPQFPDQGTVEMKTGWLTMEGGPLTEVGQCAQQVRCHPSLHTSLQTRNHASGGPVPFSTRAQLLPGLQRRLHPQSQSAFLESTRNPQQTPASGHFIDFPGNQGQTEGQERTDGLSLPGPEMPPQEPFENQRGTQD